MHVAVSCVFRYSCVPMFLCSSLHVFLRSNVLSLVVPVLPCSCVPLFLCSGVSMFLCSGGPGFLCSCETVPSVRGPFLAGSCMKELLSLAAHKHGSEDANRCTTCAVNSQTFSAIALL